MKQTAHCGSCLNTDGCLFRYGHRPSARRWCVSKSTRKVFFFRWRFLLWFHYRDRLAGWLRVPLGLPWIWFCIVVFANIFSPMEEVICTAAIWTAVSDRLDWVGTHICDFPGFVKFLCHRHGLWHREAQLSACLLLKGRGGEGCCGWLGERFLFNGRYPELGIDALLKKGRFPPLYRTEPSSAFIPEKTAFSSLRRKMLQSWRRIWLLKPKISRSRSTMIRTATDCTRPAESDGLTLRHSTGEISKPTSRSSTRLGLLGIDQIHVDGAGMLDGVKNGLFGNFVATMRCVGFCFAKHLVQMPCGEMALPSRSSSEASQTVEWHWPVFGVPSPVPSYLPK